MLHRALRLVAATALVAPLVACGGSTGFAASRPHHPCGWEKQVTYRHVIWIWMENRSYDQILGRSGGAGHLAAYADACGVATNYDAVTHPSLPNYIAATSGSTHGIKSDCSPDDCPVSGRSIFGQLDAAELTWRSFVEDMDRPCDDGTYGDYAAKHNPAVYYRAIAKSCLSNDLPMGGTKGRFSRHLDRGKLPSFTLIVPNMCNDGHDCSTAKADSWLGYWLGRITDSPIYRDGKTVVFVTWDENDYSTAGNQVATVVIGPTVAPGTRSHRHFTHYSLLRATERLLDVGHLGAAATAKSMRAAFNL